MEEDLLDQMKDGGLAVARVLCCRNRASHLWFCWSLVSVTEADRKAMTVLHSL